MPTGHSPIGCSAICRVKEYLLWCLGANLLELITKCSWCITWSGIIGFNFQKQNTTKKPKEKKIQPGVLLNLKPRIDHVLGFASAWKNTHAFIYGRYLLISFLWPKNGHRKLTNSVIYSRYHFFPWFIYAYRHIQIPPVSSLEQAMMRSWPSSSLAFRYHWPYMDSSKHV